jgi:hypothetical protein
MHAVIVNIDIDPDRVEEAEQGLTEIVVPMVSASPGFVSGVWMRSADGLQGMGVVVANSDAEATKMGEDARQGPADGPVTIRTVEVFEVLAQA